MIVNAPVNFNHETQPEFELPIKNYQEFYRFYLTALAGNNRLNELA